MFNFNTSKPSNPNLLLNSDNSATDFITKWLNNRKGQLKNNIHKYIKNNIEPNDLTINTVLQKQLSSMNNSTINIGNVGNRNGEYNKANKTIGINNQLLNPKNNRLLDITTVHERTHSLNALPQYNGIKKLLQEHYMPSATDDDYDKTVDNPEEIYSRLMSFRKINKLDPNKVINKNDLKGWSKQLNETELNKYPTKFLLDLFNNIANNVSNKPKNYIKERRLLT